MDRAKTPIYRVVSISSRDFHVRRGVFFRFSEIDTDAILPRHEGRPRRHEREAGCDGRGWIVRRAMRAADSFSRTGLWVRARHPAFPAPSCFSRTLSLQSLGRIEPREGGTVSSLRQMERAPRLALQRNRACSSSDHFCIARRNRGRGSALERRSIVAWGSSVITRRYVARRVAALLELANSTKGSTLSAVLVQRAADLKLRIDEAPRDTDNDLAAPDVVQESEGDAATRPTDPSAP